ncbi:F-box only protein 36-like [Rhopilema esculentum]|uniref:F-box only protein 36-like n=1 Tax=Rhopilema esculentum TaxID=499914 RepID=UPI0031CDE443
MAGVESLCVLGQSKPIVENKTKSVISSTKLKNMKNRPIEKVFTASGQAPSPSKDFFELIIAKDRVIWRAWRIKYKNHRMIMPSEECISYDEFQDDNRIQTEIFRNLGDDVLQVSLGYVSREWIARLPSSVLRNIAAYLSIKDITVLSQACSTLRHVAETASYGRSAIVVRLVRGTISESDERRKSAGGKCL